MKPEMIAHLQTDVVDGSRRNFIKTAGVVCAGLAVMPGLALAETQQFTPVAVSESFEWLGGV